jgi:RNA polymerase sigma factor (sigma-70 family)
MMVEDLASLIAQIKDGDSEVYEQIVRRFQDMAVGYGYASLGDLQLAEDAAQEAFIAAYFELPDLREPKAFPGWFRRILMKQIDRARRKQPSDLTLDDHLIHSGNQPTPTELVEKREVQETIWKAIQCLPTAQREVILLFYIDEYSQPDISAFLDVPISTVKIRLYYARKLLQQQLLAVIEDVLPRQRPSRNNGFTEKIMSYEVQAKQIPAMTIMSISRRVYHKELQWHLDNSINVLIVMAEAGGVKIAGLPMSIYYGAVNEAQDAEVEVCLPITGTIEARGFMKVRELPATQAASTTLTMRQSIFPGILKANDAVHDWIVSHNYQPDVVREVYLNFNRSIFSPIASLDDPCIDLIWLYR